MRFLLAFLFLAIAATSASAGQTSTTRVPNPVSKGQGAVTQSFTWPVGIPINPRGTPQYVNTLPRGADPFGSVVSLSTPVVGLSFADSVIATRVLSGASIQSAYNAGGSQITKGLDVAIWNSARLTSPCTSNDLIFHRLEDLLLNDLSALLCSVAQLKTAVPIVLDPLSGVVSFINFAQQLAITRDAAVATLALAFVKYASKATQINTAVANAKKQTTGCDYAALPALASSSAKINRDVLIVVCTAASIKAAIGIAVKV